MGRERRLRSENGYRIDVYVAKMGTERCLRSENGYRKTFTLRKWVQKRRSRCENRYITDVYVAEISPISGTNETYFLLLSFQTGCGYCPDICPKNRTKGFLGIKRCKPGKGHFMYLVSRVRKSGAVSPVPL
jgi:ferredoxin